MTVQIGLLTENSKSIVNSACRIVNTYSRSYLYRTTSGTRPTETTVVNDIGIFFGASYANDIYAIMGEVSINGASVPTRTPFLAYVVAFNWSTDFPFPHDTDPVNIPTIWSISPTVQSRYVIRDRLGKLIVNSAGTPFDGGIPIEFRCGTAIAKRNVTAVGYDIDAALANSGKLNSATFLGGEPGTVQVDITADEQYQGAFHFYAETYTFNHDPAGWQPKPANVGFFQRDAVGSNVLTRIQIDGQDCPEPEPLDDDGIFVPVASRPDGVTFVEVDYYDTMNFNSFGL